MAEEGLALVWSAADEFVAGENDEGCSRRRTSVGFVRMRARGGVVVLVAHGDVDLGVDADVVDVGDALAGFTCGDEFGDGFGAGAADEGEFAESVVGVEDDGTLFRIDRSVFVSFCHHEARPGKCVADRDLRPRG